MLLTGSLEENVLTALCWHEAHAPALALRLRPELFSTRAYRKIAETAFDHIARYGTPPRAHLPDLLEDALRRGDEGKLLWQTIEAMQRLEPELQPDYVLGELDRFIAIREMSLAVERAADALHAGDLEEAQQALYSSAPQPNMSSGIWLADPKQSLRFLDQKEEDYFPSGVEVLDDAGVRPARKTLFLVMAPTKKGKSWWLVEIAKQALLHRKSVLYVTLEMSEQQLAQRLVQALFAMTRDKAKTLRVPLFRRSETGAMNISFEELSPEVLDASSKKVVAKKLRALQKRPPLLIKEFPTGTLTTAQLSAYLDAIKRQHDFTPDVLIVDYGDLMQISREHLRVDTGRAFVELRGIAMQRNLALVTATQGNRQSANARVVNHTHVAEDWSKIATADTVCTYSQTAEEKKIGLARILVSAARDARDQYLTLISQCYDTGQFCLDSIYMSAYVQTEVDRLTGVETDDE
jgi:replicative DNA helicase